jgi:hypothetical protein
MWVILNNEQNIILGLQILVVVLDTLWGGIRKSHGGQMTLSGSGKFSLPQCDGERGAAKISLGQI